MRRGTSIAVSSAYRFRSSVPPRAALSSIRASVPQGRDDDGVVQAQPMSEYGLRNFTSLRSHRQGTSTSILAREFHATARRDNSLILGAFGVATAAYGGKLIADIVAKRGDEAAEGDAEEGDANSGEGADFGGMFSSLFSFKYYEGGFDDKMSRREAALILGIRESAGRDKVREAHRRVLMLNHPDTGGSTYLASKINEAKEL